VGLSPSDDASRGAGGAEKVYRTGTAQKERTPCWPLCNLQCPDKNFKLPANMEVANLELWAQPRRKLPYMYLRLRALVGHFQS
jgi:hypothetical protein